MEPFTSARHPVLQHLAATRAAREFGLDPHALDVLAMRFAPAPGSVERFAEAATAALLAQRMEAALTTMPPP